MTSLRPVVATDLARTYGGRTVLDGIDLTAAPGQRIGLVGENGAGKSTLLRLLAGVEAADHGTVSLPQDLAYLPQELSLADEATVGDALIQALSPLHHAIREVERLGALMAEGHSVETQFATALDWAQTHAAWDADRRATVAAQRLGVAGLDRTRRLGSLSGGERTRLAMSAMIIRRPDCVLLDEPTNHLDDGAMDLLESFLIDLPGVVVAASHDRVFLDRICTHVVDLDPGISTHGQQGRVGIRFGGGFSDYLRHKGDARRRWEQTYTEQQQQIARLREATQISTSTIAHNRGPTDNDKFIYKFKGANVDRAHARRVHDAERRLEVALREQVRKPAVPLVLGSELTGAADDAGPAVMVRDLIITDRVQVQALDVPSGGRLLVTGPNGSGKSSLLTALDGRLTPGQGTIRTTARRIRTLRQDVTFDEPGRSARQAYADALGPDRSERRPLQEVGLLHARELNTPVGDLSVGQRRRLALAICIAEAPDLLLLDEPTNHISPALATELEDAWSASTGTVIVASHDRWLRRRWDGPVITLDPSPRAGSPRARFG